MNSGYFYCPYLPLDGDDDIAAKEENPEHDFPYQIGEVVWVQGAPEKEAGISWRARIIERWYDQDHTKSHKYSPYNFMVNAIDEPPHYRKKERCVVGESEIRRFE